MSILFFFFFCSNLTFSNFRKKSVKEIETQYERAKSQFEEAHAFIKNIERTYEVNLLETKIIIINFNFSFQTVTFKLYKRKNRQMEQNESNFGQKNRLILQF